LKKTNHSADYSIPMALGHKLTKAKSRKGKAAGREKGKMPSIREEPKAYLE
jgi:hypothetical protein